MKCWALTCFLIAMLAGLFGFAEVAGGTGWIARWIAALFLVLMIGLLLMKPRRHHRARPS